MSSDTPTKLVREKQNEGRLLLVSNRLPITIKRADEGKYEMSMSSGGLVSGLSGLAKTTTFQWYGWPGLEVPEDEVVGLKDQLKSEYNAVPIMLDDELADRHYNGFSSEFLPEKCTQLGILMAVYRRYHVAAFPLPPR